MGLSVSKSPLERRNSVLRRSQRKSIHGVKAKTDKLIKSIRKFKGTEQDSDYIELKAKIEHLERELKTQVKNLQPQLRNIHNDALKRTEECYKLLEVKLEENQRKSEQAIEAADEEVEEFEETKDDERQMSEPSSPRQTVKLKLVQVEPFAQSPQLNKRLSIIKMGVPVMPVSMLEALNRKTENLEAQAEGKITQIRTAIEKLELEISTFVGNKNGKYYNKIKDYLDEYLRDLKTIPIIDEAIAEQVKLCENYIWNCLSFLDEKAINANHDGDVGVMQDNSVVNNDVVDVSLSPRSIRTTYI